MARPKLKHTATMCTVVRAAEILKINPPQLQRRLESEAFPPPTLVDANGTRYFGRDWILAAQQALQEECDSVVWMGLVELEPETRIPTEIQEPVEDMIHD